MTRPRIQGYTIDNEPIVKNLHHSKKIKIRQGDVIEFTNEIHQMAPTTPETKNGVTTNWFYNGLKTKNGTYKKYIADDIGFEIWGTNATRLQEKIGTIGRAENTSITFTTSIYEKFGSHVAGAKIFIIPTGTAYKTKEVNGATVTKRLSLGPDQNGLSEKTLSDVAVGEIELTKGEYVKLDSNYVAYHIPATSSSHAQWNGWQRLYSTYPSTSGPGENCFIGLRSDSIEDGQPVDNLEIIIASAENIGGVQVTTAELVDFVNNTPRIKELLSAEFLGQGNTKIGALKSGYRNPRSRGGDGRTIPVGVDVKIEPIDFYNPTKIYEATGYEDDETSGAFEELVYGEKEIKPSIGFNTMFLSPVINFKSDDITLDMEYSVGAWAGAGEEKLIVSLYQVNKGIVLNTLKKIDLLSATGDISLSLKGLFKLLPLRYWDNVKRKEQEEEFKLLVQYEIDDGLIYESQLRNDVLNFMMDGTYDGSTKYKKKFLFDNGSDLNFSNVEDNPIFNTNFSQQTLDPLRKAKPQNEFTLTSETAGESDFTRWKIKIPYLWRMLQEPLIRIRICKNALNSFTNGKGYVENIEGLGYSFSNDDSGKYAHWINSCAGHQIDENDTVYNDLVNLQVLRHAELNQDKNNFKLKDNQNSYNYFFSKKEEETIEILIPISANPDSPYYLEDDHIYTPWYNFIFKDEAMRKSQYFTVTLIAGIPTEEQTESQIFQNYVSIQNSINTSLREKVSSLQNKYNPSLEDFAHSEDFEKNNEHYQMISWEDGSWGKNYVPIYEEYNVDDGIKYDYGTVEFDNNEKYELKSIPASLTNSEITQNDQINGSILSKYYRVKGEMRKKGRSYFFEDKGSNSLVLDAIKKQGVGSAVYNAFYEQEVKLEKALQTWNTYWNGTASSLWSSSSAASDLTEWMNSNSNKFKIYGSSQDRVLPYVPNDVGINSIWANMQQVMFYLCSYNYHKESYTRYKSPRDTGLKDYDGANIPFARVASQEEFDYLVSNSYVKRSGADGGNSDSIIENYMNNNSYDGQMQRNFSIRNLYRGNPVNPYENLDSSPKVYLSEDGNIIYREPVIVTIPLLTLFTNIHMFNLNKFQNQGASLGIPLDFRSTINSNGDYYATPFADIHWLFKDRFSPTRLGNAQNESYQDSSTSNYDSSMDWMGNPSMPIDYTDSYSYNNYDTYSDPYSDPNYMNTYDSDGNFQGYQNSAESTNPYSQIPIDLWNEIDSELKKPIDLLIGVRWRMLYTTKTDGKLIKFNDYQPKMFEGYANSFNPFVDRDGFEHDTSKSINSKLRSPEIPFVKVYGQATRDSNLHHGTENSVVIAEDDYEKVFLSHSEWNAKGGNNTSLASMHDEKIYLNNLFKADMRSSLNYFPFKDFGMETF